MWPDPQKKLPGVAMRETLEALSSLGEPAEPGRNLGWGWGFRSLLGLLLLYNKERRAILRDCNPKTSEAPGTFRAVSF